MSSPKLLRVREFPLRGGELEFYVHVWHDKDGNLQVTAAGDVPNYYDGGEFAYRKGDPVELEIKYIEKAEELLKI